MCLISAFKNVPASIPQDALSQSLPLKVGAFPDLICLSQTALSTGGAQAPRECSTASGGILRVVPEELLPNRGETTVVASSQLRRGRSPGSGALGLRQQEDSRRALVPHWVGAGAGRQVSSHLDFVHFSFLS